MLTRSSLSVLTAALSLAACSDSVAPVLQLDRGILFTGTPTLQPGPHDIYMLRFGGAQIARLTDDNSDDLNPRWSPDGERIAFVSNRSGRWEAWVMNKDGSGAHTVSNPNDFCNAYIRLSWSPTGDRMVGDCGMVEQFVFNVSDHTSYSLTKAWGNVADYPDWSPVDDELAYLRGPDIWIANLDGSDPKVVATGANEAAWSPDGKRIAFTRLNANQSTVVWVVNADGTGEHEVTSPVNRTIADFAPAWSPDGKQIVFWRTESENPQGAAYLGVVSANGGNVARITPDSLLATRPDW